MRSTRAIHAQLEAQGGVFETQAQKVAITGRIRPGIKVLTPKARDIPKCKSVYADGWRVGASFDDIERALKQVRGCPDYPLMPKNVPWFRVCREDFTDPSHADRIMELYAEKRDGDNVPHLYQFPIVFGSDNLDVVFPETFEAWSGKELMRWSEKDPEEDCIMCMKRRDASEYAQRGRKKHWGGREKEVIEPCHPNTCDLFVSGKCTHNGALRFYVPGIPGAGFIELKFSSVYTKLAVPEVLATVMRGRGSIAWTWKGEAIFWAFKRQESVARMDWEKGKASRNKQLIISIDSRGIDLIKLAAEKERMLGYGPAHKDAPKLEAPPEERRREEVVQSDREPIYDGEPDFEDDEPVKPARRTTTVDQGPPKKEEKAGESKDEQTEEEKKPAPKKKVVAKRVSAKLRALRGDLEKVRAGLRWDDADLEVYVEGNFEGRTLEDIMSDEGAMKGLVEQMQVFLKDARGEPELPKETVTEKKEEPKETSDGAPAKDDAPPPADSEIPPPQDDDGCPF